jgi:hypothetical protein
MASIAATSTILSRGAPRLAPRATSASSSRFQSPNETGCTPRSRSSETIASRSGSARGDGAVCNRNPCRVPRERHRSLRLYRVKFAEALRCARSACRYPIRNASADFGEHA